MLRVSDCTVSEDAEVSDSSSVDATDSVLKIRGYQQSMTANFYILTVENLLFVIKANAHFFVQKVALKLIVFAGERLHM